VDQGETREASDQVTGLRLVVVGINYAPETTGIAPYTTDMCEYFAAIGVDVTAVVGLPHYPHWSVPADYRGQLPPQMINGVRVLRAPHYVPHRQTAVRRGLYEATFGRNSTRLSRHLEADAVIAVTPSLSGLRTGHRVARSTGAPFGVIVQDMLGKAARQSGIDGGRRVAHMVSRMEADALRPADLVGVIARPFSRAVTAAGIPDDRVRLLPNYTHIRSTTATRNDARLQLGWDQDDFVVMHTGNMGLKQDLGVVVEAARLADMDGRARSVRFVLVGDGSQRCELERQATGVRSIRFVAPIEEALYPIALAAADVLLVNERDTVQDMSLPSKLTSYLASGRPVLAAVVPGGATDIEVRATGAGPVVRAGDSHAILGAVLELRGDGDRRAQHGWAGRHYAETTLTREAGQARLLSFLADLTGRALPAGPPLARPARRAGRVEPVAQPAALR
jgi:glycosyltransferase involved in cell wall biosynthesis